MGRYYNGNIYGKFWFGIQSSNAADRFGVNGQIPDRIDYYFEEENLPKVESEILKIEESLGKYKDLLNAKFEQKSSYNNQEIMDELDISENQVKAILSDYADLLLGIKIKDCIKEKGSCSFEAEL